MVRFEEFENLLSPAEAADIIAFAQEKGMKRSQVVDFFNHVSKDRTSSNTFMDEEFTPAVRRLANFVAEKRATHPKPTLADRPLQARPAVQGPPWRDGHVHHVRLPEHREGRATTNFPNAKRKFKPVLGNAVLWTNYHVQRWMGMDWMVNDPEADHAGLPPKEGEKWGINVWVVDDKHWKWDYVETGLDGLTYILMAVIVLALAYAAIAA